MSKESVQFFKLFPLLDEFVSNVGPVHMFRSYWLLDEELQNEAQSRKLRYFFFALLACIRRSEIREWPSQESTKILELESEKI